MSDVADRYCSDCAWPYECAAAKSCHRRDLGEVRGEDLAGAGIAGRNPSMVIRDDVAPRPSKAEFAASAKDASARAVHWNGNSPSPERKPLMVTMTNPGGGGAFMGEARRRYVLGKGVVSIKTDDGWIPVGHVREQEREAAPDTLPRGVFEVSGTITVKNAGMVRDWHRRAKKAIGEALRVHADQLVTEARQPYPDAVLAFLYGALVPPHSSLLKVWLNGRPVSRRQLALICWLRQITELDTPLLIGYDLGEAQA